jgi:threonine synthase
MARYAARRAGMLIALEAAATLAAYHELLAGGVLEPEMETVLFFTGGGLTDIGKFV